MPTARPLPKKYLSTLNLAQEELNTIAKKSKTALLEVEARCSSLTITRTILQEIEALAYKIALELAQMQLARECDSCPSAPPTTKLQAHMFVIAGQLQRHAEEIHSALAQPVEEKTLVKQ